MNAGLYVGGATTLGAGLTALALTTEERGAKQRSEQLATARRTADQSDAAASKEGTGTWAFTAPTGPYSDRLATLSRLGTAAGIGAIATGASVAVTSGAARLALGAGALALAAGAAMALTTASTEQRELARDTPTPKWTQADF